MVEAARRPTTKRAQLMMHPAALKPGADATTHPSGDNRFKILEATMRRQQYQPDALIEVFHKAQQLFGYLSTDLLLHISHRVHKCIISPGRGDGLRRCRRAL